MLLPCVYGAFMFSSDSGLFSGFPIPVQREFVGPSACALSPLVLPQRHPWPFVVHGWMDVITLDFYFNATDMYVLIISLCFSLRSGIHLISLPRLSPKACSNPLIPPSARSLYPQGPRLTCGLWGCCCLSSVLYEHLAFTAFSSDVGKL